MPSTEWPSSEGPVFGASPEPDVPAARVEPAASEAFPLMAFLEGLRRRLVRMLIEWGVASGAAWAYRDPLMKWLQGPAKGAEFIFIAPAEYFLAVLKVALLAGALACLPLFAAEFAGLLWPLVPRRRRGWMLALCALAPLLMWAGAAFSYYVLLPAGLGFLLSISPAEIAAKLAVGTYLGFVLVLLAAGAVVFLLPLAIMGLALAGWVSAQRLGRFRPYFWVLSLAAGAILSPSADVVSQLMLAGALAGLYEFSILLVRLAAGLDSRAASSAR